MPLPPFIAEYIPPDVLPALNEEWDRLKAQQGVLRGLEDSVTALREQMRISDQERARFCDLSPISLSPGKHSCGVARQADLEKGINFELSISRRRI